MTDQESVWDYPRPPKLQRIDRHVTVEFGGEVIADTRRAIRFLETSHPPTYYIPPEDCRLDYFVKINEHTLCEWKGQAHYYDLEVGELKSFKAAWAYANPVERYAECRGYVAFYPSRVAACFVDGERVQAQDGDFYGGWITANIKGPFKGGAGTLGW